MHAPNPAEPALTAVKKGLSSWAQMMVDFYKNGNDAIKGLIRLLENLRKQSATEPSRDATTSTAPAKVENIDLSSAVANIPSRPVPGGDLGGGITGPKR